MALTILQIATRIACTPTTSYVISSYSNVRLQQPSMDSLTPSVESRVANDMALVSLDDVTETAKVIEKVESDSKFTGIEISESSTIKTGAKVKEEELLAIKEIIEEDLKSATVINEKEEITTEVPTTVSELKDEIQPTTLKSTIE